jgi:putative tricarboxylic transport membrane protein
MVTELRETPAWDEVLARNGWVDSFMTGDEFADFIAEETRLTTAVIEELGL